MKISPLCLSVLLPCALLSAETLPFADDFKNHLDSGWSWVRENPKNWRIVPEGLQIMIEPGNMWGSQNDGRNILWRPLPSSTNGVAFELTVQNVPTNQYEQVDLVWYLDDSNMVKLGLELVDGKLSIVMGREEDDKTRTIALPTTDLTTVRLRLELSDASIRGSFRAPDSDLWQVAGTCELPIVPGLKPKVAIQCYQGAPGVEHWATLSHFTMEASKEAVRK